LIFSTTGGGAVANISIPSGVGNGGTVSNCTLLHPNVNSQLGSSNTTNKLMFQNCLFLGSAAFFINPAGTINAQYNRYVCALGTNGVSGTGSTTGGLIGLDFGNARLTGYGLNDFFGSNAGAANIAFGTASGAPVSDLYGVTWLAAPDAGAVQRSALSNFQPPTAPYAPAERNASAITIAPGSTSQSIELYLTASTSGLSARYNRTRTASVSIPLVARTITQAWTSGGFAEVDPVEMPGVYRLDIPNEALVGGADDVTVTVRGASGTNGAVVSIDMRNYSFISTTGYKLISDQLGANGALDVIKGSSITVKLQITDVNQKPVPIGSATCTVQVYSLNNLVATYPTVIQYQSNGEMTFVLDTAVTTAPGSYNIYVNRNNGGSDTVVYGPMKLTVSNL